MFFCFFFFFFRFCFCFCFCFSFWKCKQPFQIIMIIIICNLIVPSTTEGGAAPTGMFTMISFPKKPPNTSFERERERERESLITVDIYYPCKSLLSGDKPHIHPPLPPPPPPNVPFRAASLSAKKKERFAAAARETGDLCTPLSLQ